MYACPPDAGWVRDTVGVWVHLQFKEHHRVRSTVTTGETEAQRGKEASIGPRSCFSFPQKQSHK